MPEIGTSGLMSRIGKRSQGRADCGATPKGWYQATANLPLPRPILTLLKVVSMVRPEPNAWLITRRSSSAL